MLFSQRFLCKINCFIKEPSTLLEQLKISLMSRSNRKKTEVTNKIPTIQLNNWDPQGIACVSYDTITNALTCYKKLRVFHITPVRWIGEKLLSWAKVKFLLHCFIPVRRYSKCTLYLQT